MACAIAWKRFLNPNEEHFEKATIAQLMELMGRYYYSDDKVLEEARSGLDFKASSGP